MRRQAKLEHLGQFDSPQSNHSERLDLFVCNLPSFVWGGENRRETEVIKGWEGRGISRKLM